VHRHLATRVLAASLALAALAAAQTTLMVPSPAYPFINNAILAASPGDTVLVAPGSYTEAVDLFGRAITLKSSCGPGVTFLDGAGVLRPLRVICGEGLNTIIEGFTIVNGSTISGGGVWCLFSSPTIRNCIIKNNALFLPGGLNDGGGGILLSFSSPTFENCVITGNSSMQYGGGVLIRSSSPTFTNCTIAGNTASIMGDGVMVLADNCCATTLPSAPTFINCVIWGNGSLDLGLAAAPNTVTLVNCDVGGWGTAPGGNIDADPLYFDPANEDYRLGPGSPAIDTGMGVPGQLAVDFEGDPRLFGIAVDMGADEYTGPLLAACAAGNLLPVPTDVLRIGGTAGFTGRQVNVGAGTLFGISVARPSLVLGQAPFAIFARLGIPAASEATILPAPVGTMCFAPCPAAPGANPLLFTVTNNIIPGPCGELISSLPAPWSSPMIAAPPFSFQLTLQGMIIDVTATLHVTNAVFLDVM